MLSLLPLAPAQTPQRDSESIEITRANLEQSEEGYRLALSFSFELPRALEDVVLRGIPLYFTTEVEISRPRWYWFDERAIAVSRTVRLSYNVLTQEFHVSSGGGLYQSFNSLEDALSVIKRPARWLIAEKGALKPGETYVVALRMGLDVARLPKPFQVHAINSSDWRFSSDWKYLTFKAE